jgi:hypothetical protein
MYKMTRAQFEKLPKVKQEKLKEEAAARQGQ